MKTRYIAILFAIAFVIQTTLVNIFAIYGIGPNILLVLMVTICYLYEESLPALVCGTVTAFLYDICFAQYTGIAALALLCVGVGTIGVCRIVNRDRVLALVIITAVGTLVYHLISWCILAMGGRGYSFLYMLKYQPFYMLYNVAIGCIVYFALRKWKKRQRKSRYYL